jgi:DNA-directed RNA polymerase subunit K
MQNSFTKYEIARILGARALQIAMDAPLLIKVDKEKLEAVKYDPLRIAELEFYAGVLPITVKRPMPKKIEAKLKREVEEKKDETEKTEKTEDKVVEKKEGEEEKSVEEEGEIMELVTPEDEMENTENSSEEEI